MSNKQPNKSLPSKKTLKIVKPELSDSDQEDSALDALGYITFFPKTVDT